MLEAQETYENVTTPTRRSGMADTHSFRLSRNETDETRNYSAVENGSVRSP